jgi:cytochrome c553
MVPALAAEPAGTFATEGLDPQQLMEKDLVVRAKLDARIEEIRSDPGAQERIDSTGRKRTVLCASCHGSDGFSTRPEIPNLAGQDPAYLVEQFQRFGDGRRYDAVMSSLAHTFSEDEKIMLALYYSAMQAKPSGGGTQEQIARGKQQFEQYCQECHGADGRGAGGYARLAGQKPQYVVNMLQQFRSGSTRRPNPWMTAAATRLTEQGMWDVAYYIANLP